MAIEIRPTGGALGAEVLGVDLAQPLNDADFATVRQAWFDHLLLLFRGQDVPAAQQAGFAARFGELDGVPGWRDKHATGEEKILIISNVKQNGEALGVLGDGELEWHTDMSYITVPPSVSMLHAREVPDSGGDTHFMNMYAVYEALPADLVEAVRGQVLNHDSSYDSSNNLRPGAVEVTRPSEAPGARHPLVRRHPETGRPSLYLGRRRNAWVVGMEEADSERLLDRLWAFARQLEFAWVHRWKTGDVLMWDNRCTMHRRDSFDPAARRVMYRAQVKGEAPLAADSMAA
jgi:taurine dioxygenase